MIRILFITIFSIFLLKAEVQNLSLFNNIKKVVQKEEYISLAINKYIVDFGELPTTTDDDGNIVFDWDKLTTNDYLGADFNKINPYTNQELDVYFINGFAFIKGVISSEENYNSEHMYLYNYYVDQNNRVNTIAAKTTQAANLLKGSQVKYQNLQKEIVKVLQAYENNNSLPTIGSTNTCVADEKFYEILGNELVLRYCESTGVAFDIYSSGENLVINDEKYLDIIEAPIGSNAFVKNVSENKWYEYYYQGKVDSTKWIKREITMGGSGTGDGGDTQEEVVPLKVVSGDKILVLRENIGCSLVGGDINCWGNNTNNKFGIDSSENPNADIVNTPIMLKSEALDKRFCIWIFCFDIPFWENQAVRTKYKSLALNTQDICAISEDNNLYCSGSYSGKTYLDKVKDNVKSVAMTPSAIAIVETDGDLLIKGVNLNGILGTQNDNEEASLSNFTRIKTGFKEVFSLSGTNTFGAIDNSNKFWIWGQRTLGSLNTPSKLDNSINVEEVFINPSEFIIKDSLGRYIKTKSIDEVEVINGLSDVKNIVISKIEENDEVLYVNNSGELVPTSSDLLKCTQANGDNCTTAQNTIFAENLAAIKNINNLHIYAKMGELSIPNPSITIEGGTFAGGNSCSAGISQTGTFNITDSFTLSAYVKSQNVQTGTRKYILGIKDGSNNIELVQKKDDLILEINNSTFQADAVIQKDKLHFIVATYDGSKVKIYVDSQLKYTANLSGNIGISSGDIEVGDDSNSNSNKCFEGDLSDIRIFNKSLSQEQIISIYSVPSSGTASSNSFDTRFTEWEGLSTNTNDTSPSKNDDQLYFTGNLNSKLELDKGDDLVQILGNANKEIKGEKGNDKIKINGDANGKIELDEGDNELVILGNANKEIIAKNDDDKITIKGRANGKIETGKGDDKVQIFGDLNKELITKEGNDDIYIKGTVNGKIETEKNNDRIIIEGNVNKEILLGEGDDIIQIDGRINDKIEGDKGTNSIILNYYTKSDYDSNRTLRNRLKDFDNYLFKDGQTIGDDSVFGGFGNAAGNGNDNSQSQDSILTEKDKFICFISEENASSKLYCWGHLSNRLPLLSTSLYKDSKISELNNYFYNSNETSAEQKTYDQYFDNGKVFLPYPTYIGTFDYDFKFR